MIVLNIHSYSPKSDRATQICELITEIIKLCLNEF